MNNKKRGSLTAEATIVMPIVIIVVMMVIRISIIHYQNAVLSAEAMRVASRTASYWNEIDVSDPAVFNSTDTAKGWITDNSFLEHNPYQSVVEMFNSSGGVQKKLSSATAYAAKVMSKAPKLLEGQITVKGVEVKREKGFLQNYITVTVIRTDENPLGHLYKKIGLTTEDELKVTAKSTQIDTTEFIRNASLIYDILKGEYAK